MSVYTLSISHEGAMKFWNFETLNSLHKYPCSYPVHICDSNHTQRRRKMAYPAWTNAFSPFEWTSPLPPVPPFLLKQNISLLRTLLKLTHHKMKLDNAICRWLYPLKLSILCFGNVLYSLSCYLGWAFISFCCWCTYHMQIFCNITKVQLGRVGGKLPPKQM